MLQDGTEKVLVERFRDEHTLIGPPLLLRPMYDMAESLVSSGFMRAWLVEQVQNALQKGVVFENRGVSGESVKSRYRLATDEDVQGLVKSGQYAAATYQADRAPDARIKSGEDQGTSKDVKKLAELIQKHTKAAKKNPNAKARSGYVLAAIPAAKQQVLVDQLQPQGKIIYKMLTEFGQATLTSDQVRQILETRVVELKTKQDVMKLFGFHMSQYYVKLGLIAYA